MQLSIIVPVYNTEPYLRECIDSVLAQTYGDFELILVDDGSTDRSGAICDEYAERDARIVVIHQKNGGLSAARNAGLVYAQGKYLLYLDSDDKLWTDALALLVDEAERNQLDQLIFGADVFCKLGEQVGEIDNGYYTITNEVSRRVMSGPDLFHVLMCAQKFNVCTPLRLIRKDSLPLGLRFPVGLVHEDNYYTPLALLSARRAMAIPTALYQRRIRAGSITTRDGQQRRHADGYWGVYRLLKKSNIVKYLSPDVRVSFRQYLRDVRNKGLELGNHRWRLMMCLLIDTILDKGIRYAFRRAIKYVKVGK